MTWIRTNRSPLLAATTKNCSRHSGNWWRNEMPCSVRLNDCGRGEKSFLTSTHFRFNSAQGKRPGRGGFVSSWIRQPLWHQFL
jgi:hypothetical protein